MLQFNPAFKLHVDRWAVNKYYDCFDCPEPGSCDIDMDSRECGDCKKGNSVYGNGTCDINGTLMTLQGTLDQQYNIGDFYDLGGGSNDPIFFFHHANVDRYLFEWQLRNYDKRPYYTFPNSSSDFAHGAKLDDVISDEFPFYNLDLFENSDEYDVEGPYTHRDVLDATQFLVNSYTYDTVLELVKQPLVHTSSSTSVDNSGSNGGDTDGDDDELSSVSITIIVCVFWLSFSYTFVFLLCFGCFL